VRCRSRWDCLRALSPHTSAPRCTSATRAAASRGATDRRRGPTATTSSTGRTAVQPSSTTSSIVNTTPREPPSEITVGCRRISSQGWVRSAELLRTAADKMIGTSLLKEARA
jgi:hypothetical protein